MKAATLLTLTVVLISSVACQQQAPPAQSQPAPPQVAAQQPAAQQPVAQQSATQQVAAAAPAPPAMTVADLPDYPGATRVKLENGPKKGFARETEAKFTTTDPLDKVKGFYEEAIKSNGWQIVSITQKPYETKWNLTKGTSLGEVSVEAEHAGAVSIKLERKDR